MAGAEEGARGGGIAPGESAFAPSCAWNSRGSLVSDIASGAPVSRKRTTHKCRESHLVWTKCMSQFVIQCLLVLSLFLCPDPCLLLVFASLCRGSSEKRAARVNATNRGNRVRARRPL